MACKSSDQVTKLCTCSAVGISVHSSPQAADKMGLNSAVVIRAVYGHVMRAFESAFCVRANTFGIYIGV